MLSLAGDLRLPRILFMSAPTPSSTVEPIRDPKSVASGRQRLLEAALELFAERGFDGASVRDITERAEVSLGLVNKHFGSKEGLRQAIDAWLLEVFDEGHRRVRDEDPLELLSNYEYRGLQELGLDQDVADAMWVYLRRSLVEQRAASVEITRRFWELRLSQVLAWKEAGRLRDDVDIHDIVELLVSTALGVVAFQPVFEQALGPTFNEKAMCERRARFFGLIMERALLDPEARRDESD